MVKILYVLLISIMFGHFGFCHTTQPIDAEQFILSTYKECNIIGISEGPHGLENSHKFFLKLVSNKKFQKTINVLIVEFCSIEYQDVLDDYIMGKKNNIKELRKAWRESTQNSNGHWDAPVYFNLLKKIRDVNKKLPKKKKIRVLAGDPGMDWQSINTNKDYFRGLSQRDILPAHLAIEYGITLNKKVLLIYGGLHFPKKSDEKQDSTYWTITSVVNKRYPGSMKVIEILDVSQFNLGGETEKLPIFSIIDFSNSEAGNLPAEKVFPSVINQKGEKIEVYKGYKVKDIIDAFLYVGPSATWKISEAPKSVYKDDEYWNELNRRNKIIWGEALDESLRK